MQKGRKGGKRERERERDAKREVLRLIDHMEAHSGKIFAKDGILSLSGYAVR